MGKFINFTEIGRKFINFGGNRGEYAICIIGLERMDASECCNTFIFQCVLVDILNLNLYLNICTNTCFNIYVNACVITYFSTDTGMPTESSVEP